LEEVLVVTQVEDKEPAPSENTSVRAVDILAQRLPSVPDKPAENPDKPKAAGAAAAPTATPASAEAPKVAKPAVAKPAVSKPNEGIASVVPTPNAPDAGRSIVPVTPAQKPASPAPKTANDQKAAPAQHANDSKNSAKPANPPQTTNAPPTTPPQDQPQ
jgi:hypothetical protein